MSSEMIAVVIGGLLGILGGAIQSFLLGRNSTIYSRREKREEAYLGYIDALLKIKVDFQYGTIDSGSFWTSFRPIQSKLRLYGSKKIIAEANEFEGHLYECWQCSGFEIGNTEQMRENLIKHMREELHIQ